jgi:quercetin dioxygenase-like cupin family protein
MGMVLEGEIELTISGETKKLTKGQMFLVPPNAEHSAVIGEQPTVVLDVFSPPREDYK